MDLAPVEIFKEVEEYDFTFNAGMSLPILIDEDAGDVIHELADRFTIDLTAKPSMLKPDEILQPESITIYKTSLAAVHQRTRLLRQATPDEKFELQKTLLNIGKSVN